MTYARFGLIGGIYSWSVKMADYWKSQPRKYCEICKCWFGDNKVSVEFHERGKRHQANVAKTLREAREKGVKKQDAEQKLMNDLDAIEKAAFKSFEKDMARDVSLAQKDTSYHSALMQKKKKAWDDEERQQQVDKDRREAALIASAIARTHASLPQPGEKTKEEASPKPPPPPNPWSKLTSPDGLTYYYNAITKVSRWDCPPEFEESAKNDSKNQTQSERATAGSKRSIEPAATVGSDKNISQPKRSSGDVYGSWTTVATRERSTGVDSENAHKRLYMTEEDDSEESDEGDSFKGKIRFKEKTVASSGSSVADSQSSVLPTNTYFKGFGFKKKVQANVRKRNVDL